MYCSKCGKQNLDNAKFCANCGTPFTGTPNQQNTPPTQTSVQPPPQYAAVGEKSKLAAGLLGIFLGGWGIHRFYLGYVGIGIVQIIVTIVTFGFGALWGFIEGILILTGTFNKDAKGFLIKGD